MNNKLFIKITLIAVILLFAGVIVGRVNVVHAQLAALTTTAATNVDTTKATLNGTANPNNLGGVTGYFRYATGASLACDDVTGTRFPASGGSVISNGGVAVAFSQSLTGLNAATQYAYCAYGSNVNGVGKAASSQTFTTPTNTAGCAPPASGSFQITSSCYFPNQFDGIDAGGSTSTTLTNTGVFTLPSGMTLTVGSAVPNQKIAYGSISKPGAVIVKFSGSQLIKGSVWAPDTDGDGYPDSASPAYQISATRPANYVRRSWMGSNVSTADCAPSFSGLNTSCAPGVTTTAASNITNNSATLNGTATAATYTGTGSFRYGSSFTSCAGLGSTSSTTALTTSSTSNPSTTLGIGISTLTGNTTYYYCATANNNWNASTTTNDADANKQSFLTKPGAPTSVSAAAASQTQMNVSWTAPTGGATSYNLIWCSGASCSPVTTITGVTSIYAHIGLTCGTTYGYTVQAVNTTGTTNSTPVAYGTTSACTAPTITTPTKGSYTVSSATLGGNVTSDGGATITGRGVAVGTSLNPICGTGLTGTGACYTTTGTTGVFTVSATGLSPNTLYHYRAYATNSVGTSYTTDDTFYTIPNTPTITSVGSPTQTTLNITWSAPTGGANSYNLVWCSGASCTPLTTITGVTSVYTHNGPLSCNTPYSYYLIALNAGGGTSANSATVANTNTSACATAPSITAQGATSITNTGATLTSTVNPNNGTTSITYRYSTSNVVCSSLASTLLGPTGLTGSTAISPNSTALGSLNGNTTYYYCSTANNSAGTTNAVSNGDANSNFLTLPGAPTSVTGGSATYTSVSVSWTAPTGGAASYDLWRCTGTGCTTFAQITAGVTSPSSDTGLTCGTIYRYRIRANNASGSTDSASSADVSTSACKTNGTACAAAGECASGICYVDADNDGYAPVSMTGATCRAISSVGTDCYDSNANAHPGSTYSSSTNRGDGSYDYNCDGLQTVTGSPSYACSSSPNTYMDPGVGCGQVSPNQCLSVSGTICGSLGYLNTKDMSTIYYTSPTCSSGGFNAYNQYDGVSLTKCN